MRKVVNRLCRTLAIVLVLVNSQINVFAEISSNRLLNPSFEDGINNWEITSDFKEPHEHDKVEVNTDMPNTGNKSLHFYGKNDFEFTISQEVRGLAEGYYRVAVWSEGAEDIRGHVSVTIKTTDQSIMLNSFENRGWQEWQEVVSEEIAVSGGSCVVSINVKGNAGYWGHIDDITLVKTKAFIDEEQDIVSAEQQKVSTIINEHPSMPDKVRVIYATGDDGIAIVVWDNIDAQEYGRLGTFTVNGTIEGTDITCYATITVDYRSFDLNQDGEINLIDLAELSYYYGKSKIHMTQTQWDKISYIDLNNDNEINFQDLKLLSNKIR